MRRRQSPFSLKALKASRRRTQVKARRAFVEALEGRVLLSSAALVASSIANQTMADLPAAERFAISAALVQDARLTASDGATNDYFGYAVAVSGNTVVIGEDGATVSGHAGQGAAYVFTESGSGWANMTQTAELTASDGAANAYFGDSVAIDGDTVVVGAPGVTVSGHGDQGAVYVFTEPGSGWTNMTQTARLIVSDGAASDQLGSSVAISGDTVVAGAPNATVGVNAGQGAAYVFAEPGAVWSNETQIAKLTASDGAADDTFGAALAMDGNTVVVGAAGATVGGNSGQGAAYVFAEPGAGWTNMIQNAKLTASDGADGDGFGASVSLSGETVVVAAPYAAVGANGGQGAAYVFVEPGAGWTDQTQTAKLTASDGAAYDDFGASVSISGAAVAIGSPYATVDGDIYRGATYVFTEPVAGWANETQLTKLTATDGAVDDRFGSSVAISSNNVVVGAPFENHQGAGYVFGPDIASKLAFSVQPGNAVAGSALAPAITVAVEDAAGNTFTGDDTSTVTLTLDGGIFASGSTTTAVVSGGVATFSNLKIDATGNYSLSAGDGAMTGVMSGIFNISAAAAAKLAFSVQPGNAVAGVAIAPAVVVKVEDAYGNMVTSDTSTVTLGLSSGSFASGSAVTVAVLGGVATFSNLIVNTIAANYAISAGDGVLADATSSFFNITSSTATIGGEVFNDVKGKGILTRKDRGMSGVTVSIQAERGQKLVRKAKTIITNALGQYSLAGLAPGLYQISEAVPAGYKQTAPLPGVYNVTVSAGQKLTGENFGNRK